MRRAARVIAIAAGLAAGLPAAAAAEYSPTLEVRLSDYGPGVAPAVSSVMRQGPSEDTTEAIAVRFPLGFSYNPAFAVPGCRPAHEAANACPPESRLGSVRVVTPLGNATGPVHLTQDFRLHIPLEAYFGIYRQAISGRITTRDDGSGELAFEGLPSVSVTEATISLDGGPRAIFVTPYSCGRYEVTARFVSHTTQAVEHTLPIDIGGCPVVPAVESARVAPARIGRGRAATIRWRLSAAGERTEIEVFRLSRGAERSLGTLRGPAAAGENAMRLPARVRGRALRPGAYRLMLRAIGAGGAVSRARSVEFRLSR